MEANPTPPRSSRMSRGRVSIMPEANGNSSIITPLRKGFVRPSMVGEAGGSPLVTTPLRKRTSQTPHPVVLNIVSDDIERHARRSMVAINKRLSSIPNLSPIVGLQRLMDESEMKDQIEICSKLFIENKINTKNAWELKIFDIMSQLVVSNQPNVLQLAGTTLDIGARVYAVRVDDVHARCLKLASSMNTVIHQNRQSGDDSDCGGGDEAYQSKRAKTQRKKQKKRFLGHVVPEKNPMLEHQGKLNVPLKLLEPVCFSTKEDIDISATDNLFTVKFRNHPATHDLDFMANGIHWVKITDHDVITSETTIISTTCPKLRNVKLCRAFADFEIGAWNPDEEAKWVSDSINDIVLDENGCPVVELDGSIHDIFGNDNDNTDNDGASEEHIHEFQFRANGKMANIVDALPGEHRSAHEYGYNTLLTTSTGKIMEKMWAGPSHWKLKCIKRGPARYSGSTVQKQRPAPRRRAKIVEKMDFSLPDEPFEFIKKPPINHNKRLPTTANLRKISLPNTFPESLFPEDEGDVHRCLLKPPLLIMSNLAPQNPASDDCDVSVYNYENPSDSQYCSQNTDDQIIGDEENAVAAQDNLLSEHLVDAPEIVPTFSMPYALHAKKMDMKKLKSAVLKSLENETTELDGSTLFSHLYQKLPNNLNNDMKKELSCPLAFLAMLHVANENNFMLRQEFGSNKDFTIRKID